jgi:hypothetical protein
MSTRVNVLSTLSKCSKLVHLDLWSIDPSFHIFDLLHVVSTLSCLKFFRFPLQSPDSSNLGENDSERREGLPSWPDGLEMIHIPCGLETGCIVAFEKVPDSLTSLVIEESFDHINAAALDKVFDLIGPQIQSLKVEYNDGALLYM